MVDVSNKTLAVLIGTTLFVLLVGTWLNLGADLPASITGHATTGTGTVNLSINSTLAIQVNALYNNINFGTCTPRPAATYSCGTDDSSICTGSNALGNCTGDTTSPQFIEVDNVGNVDANVSVSSECTAAQLIGGTSPAFTFVTTQCNGTGVSAWTSLDSAAVACHNVSYKGGAMRLFANVTIPYDAVGGTGGCTDTQSTLTFTGTQA
jgi:hypothetical protein